MRRLIGALLLTAVATSACTSSGSEGDTEDFRPAAAPAVLLPLLGADAPPIRIGVVVTGAATRGEGAEFLAPAAGARVAEFRLDGVGNQVDLQVVDDRGSAEGAAAAVRQLVGAGVAGIVYASNGSHVASALDVAAAGSTAVLLPYETRAALTGDSTWHTGPSDEQVASRVSELLADRGQRLPLVVGADGAGAALGELVPADHRVVVTPGDALAGQVTAAAAALGDGRADGIVVDASAETSAEVVAALQGLAPQAPVVLGPAALSPSFATRLGDLGRAGGATTAGQFLTVGPAAADSSTDQGVVDFLAAVRLAAQDADLPALVGPEAFGVAAASTADIRSHDAVLAIAAAAAEAGSPEPASVLGALRGLTLDAGSGLAGPALDFGQPQALADDDVAVLQATTRGPGRFVDDEPALSWFVLPAVS